MNTVYATRSNKIIALVKLFALTTCYLLVSQVHGQTPWAGAQSAVSNTAPAAEFANPDIASLNQKVRDEYAAGNTQIALESAKSLVAISIQQYGAKSTEVANALTNLAIVQSATDEKAAALENFVVAIDMLERSQNDLVSDDLINPLAGLTSLYIGANEWGSAIPVLERMIHISHVNNGPLNLEQLDEMQSLSQAYLATGDQEKATKIRKNMFRLQIRAYDPQSDEFIDALMTRARWYLHVGDYETSVQAYRRTLHAIEKNHGLNDARKITPLTEMAIASSRQEHQRGAAPRGASTQAMGGGQTGRAKGTHDQSRRAMSSAVRVAKIYANENPQQLIRTLTDQGDLFIQSGRLQNARGSYREAWQLMNETPDSEALAEELFKTAKPIAAITPPKLHSGVSQATGPAASNKLEQGFVEVSFTVSRAGRAKGFVVLDSSPPGLMDDRVINTIKRNYYRPQLIDGEVARLEGVTLRHDFYYRSDKLSEREQKIIARNQQERANAVPEISNEDAAEPSDDAGAIAGESADESG